MQDFNYLNVQRTTRSIIRDNVPEEVLSQSSCSSKHAAGVHGNGQCSKRLQENPNNYRSRHRHLRGHSGIVNATYANYDGALAFNIRLLIATEQTAFQMQSHLFAANKDEQMSRMGFCRYRDLQMFDIDAKKDNEDANKQRSR